MVAVKVKIGGAWSGVLEIEVEEWTVSMLKQEVANRSSDFVGPDGLNLIFAGRVLRDGDDKLNQLGVKNNSKILASKVSTALDHNGKSVKDEFLAEEERANRLSRLKATVTALASRHADGTLPVEDFNLELENQNGKTVKLGSETDQRAIMMGLMLHASAKTFLRREQYKDALEVLTMGEEAFSLCNPKVIEMVDNVSIVQIDIVWCYFMLRDIRWLSVAGIRLAKAREGIERAHGKESSRLRILQGERYPELALHMRMELLEGVVAYHSGQLQKAKKALISAQTRFNQLQVKDETLTLLMNMGYKERESKRALRMNNLDVERAVEFLVEETVKRTQKREQNLQRQKEILEQKGYGVTPLKKAVDMNKVNYFNSIGFERELAAEALRRNENDTQKSLDDLTNPETNATIQSDIISRKRRKLRKATSAARDSLVAMGFPTAAVDEALRRFDIEEHALNHLLAAPANGSTAGSANANPNPSAPAPGTENAPPVHANESNAESSTGESSVERDVEMEDALTEELQHADAYSDYDIEVTKEGEAVAEYLALLVSAENIPPVSV